MKVQIFISFLCLVIYEHISRVNNLYPVAPVLNKIADWLCQTWYRIGELITRISAFIEYLNIEEIHKTVQSLIEPLLEIFFSWTNIIKGYVETSFTYAHPGVVFLGTVLLLVALDQSIAYWRKRRSFFGTIILIIRGD